MKYIMQTVGASLLAAVVACGGGEGISRTASPEAPATPSLQQRDRPADNLPPVPVSAVPEGALLVRNEGGWTFAIGAGGEVLDYGRGVFSISPDRRRVAFARQESVDTFTGIGIAAGEATEMVEERAWDSNQGVGYASLLWSRDGSQLAYTLPDERASDKVHIYVVNKDGGGKRQITSTPGQYYPVGWTAGGRLLVQSVRGLALMGEGSEMLPGPQGIHIMNVTLSPDGRQVAVQSGDSGVAKELWVVDVESGVARLVADLGGSARLPGADLYVSAGLPPVIADDNANSLLKGPPPAVWSPDSTRIAYFVSYTNEDGDFTSDLWLADLHADENRQVAADTWYTPAWSPDGQYLAYIRESNELALLGVDGATVDTDVRAEQVAWSKNGRLIAQLGGLVSFVDPGTGQAREVSTPDGRPVSADYIGGEPELWSPSGRYLTFTSHRGYDLPIGSLYVLDCGTGSATLILDEGSFYPLGWLRSA